MIRFFRGFSLRQRFLVAPLLGLVVCSLLTAAFIYESRRENALLGDITTGSRAAFNEYSAVFTNLAEQHMALYELLYNAGNADEKALYDQTKLHLYKIQGAIEDLEQTLQRKDGNTGLPADFVALRNDVRKEALTRTHAYRDGVTAALRMATAAIELAPRQLAVANERFTAMNGSLLAFLEMERNAINLKTAARVRNSETNSTTIAFIGVSIAASLFVLSVLLARLLSRSIGTQINALTELGTQAGARFENGGSDEVERMTLAIAAFRQSLLELRESESRFRGLTELSSDFYWETDAEHRMLRMTHGSRYKPAVVGARGKTRWEAPSTHPDAAGWAAHRAMLDAAAPFRDFEVGRLDAEGVERHLSISGEPEFGESGAFKGYRGVGKDITGQKRAEIRIKRLNRVHALLSGINGAIVRIRDRQQLFAEACRIAVETGGLRFAWLCVVDETGMRLLPVASAGADDGFLETIRDRLSLRDDAPEAHGIGARAVRERRAFVVNDLEADADLKPKYKKSHADRGIKSVAALPLLIAGKAVGAFALHAGETGFFDDDEMKLLNEVAGNIAFALEHIEKEEKVQRLTRVHAVLSGINSLIVRIRDKDELFGEACRIAVEYGKFRMAWIGVVDRSAMKVVPVASAGVEPEFLALIKDRFSLLEDSPLGNTISARAVREKKVIVSNAIGDDTEVFFAKDLIARGVHSIAILPLLVSDDVAGVLALYAGETGFFDDEEMKLLTELAGDIAFALDHIEKAEKLDYLAYYDALTGLANRSLFLERVAQYMRSAAAGGHKLAIGLIDLERFKNINDSLGRPAGDALLKQVGEWLTRTMGNASLLARIGADHFAVVLPEVKQDGNLVRLIEKTMHAFLEHPFRLNDAEFRVAFKMGAALFPDDGVDADTLFKNAEAALKKAKASGDRYLFYAQKMTETVAGKLTLENQLRQALDKEEFVLHYQPKVSLASGKLTGAEALIRWNDPRTGLVPPGRFIPVLEETGLIFEVGRWALRRALEDYLRWRNAGLPAVRIAVNVSPLQLRNRGFIAEIEQAIGIDAHAPAGLELEITESLIMDDVKRNIASLQVIQGMGITIAIDDFGTGFSSLSYLAKLPVDTLKIDRSFVIDMTAGAQGLALVSTIITLAHSLKLKVVAEGVETEEQSRLLLSLDCDEMQGFLFSKPVPSELFEARFLAPPSVNERSSNAELQT